MMIEIVSNYIKDTSMNVLTKVLEMAGCCTASSSNDKYATIATGQSIEMFLYCQERKVSY